MTHEILKRVSYHAVYDDSILGALKFASETGFSGVQVADETNHLSFETLSAQDLAEIQDFIWYSGMKVSLHAPDETTSLFTPSRILREGIHVYYRDLFRFARAVGVHVVTIHLGSPAQFPTDTSPEKNLPVRDLERCGDMAQRSLDFLVEEASDSFALCVENYRLDSFSLSLLEPYVSDGRLSLCWDLAKSHKNSELQDYFWSHLDAVRQVHLHDIRSVDGRPRSHRVIGTGEIDFGSYLVRMKDADILDYCIEVRPREKAVESLRALGCILDNLGIA